MIRRALPALVVIVVANAAMLGGVAINRSGEPDATVTMTERELGMGVISDRDSSRRLRIGIDRWGFGAYPRWLTAAKLATLGFDVSAPATSASSEFYMRQLPRRALVVLEYDGPSWQSHVRELRRREALRAGQLEEVRRGERDSSAVTEIAEIDAGQLEKSLSRLVPVDAGIDAAALRRVYADRRKYIIAPATIRIGWTTDENEPRISGTIVMVTDSLVVPRRWRDVLDSVSQGPEPYGHQGPPRYAATVAYGRRFEPWIVSIEKIDTPSPPH